MNGLRNGRKVRRSSVFGLVGALIVSMLATGIAQAATFTLNIEHYVFSPSPLTIVAGTTVKWVNKDPTQHQIVSDTGAFPSSKLLDTGQSYAVKFSKAGTFNYHDGFNAFITGTIIVTGVPKATPKPTPKPTAKATPKPTLKATAAATAAPTATAAAAPSDAAAASPAPSDAGGAITASPGTDGTAAPGGSTDGTATGSSGGSLDIGSILVGLALAVVLFFAWIGLQSYRRNRPGPPTGGGGAGGRSAGPGGGGAGGGSADPGGESGDGGMGSGGGTGGGGAAGNGAASHAVAQSSALAPSATSATVPPSPAPEPPSTPMSPASRRLVRRTGTYQAIDEDAPIGGG